jgi:light-regulated signal transduction histidine kinase (bacteriophytochrome)
MTPGMPLPPPFGQADLSNCEREQIHLAGSIQPHGALLVLSEPDYVIIQASSNASAFLGLRPDIAGRSLDDLDGDLLERLTPHIRDSLRTIPNAFRCRMGNPATEFDGLVHRLPEGALIVELERALPALGICRSIEGALSEILGASSLRQLCDEAAKAVQDLTGYDRVMIYRFDAEGHGQVFSEQRKPELEPYLGNWYPASDIPQIARRLYERNRVRMLADVNYKPVPLSPQLFPVTGASLDMSLCSLRSMSPIHIEYLKNMGVAATLVASLIVGGKLWGLISCHHYVPRLTSYEIRAACEIFAEVISTRIAALESFARAHAEMSIRRLENRMLESLSRDGEWTSALFNSPQTLLQLVGATGVALLFEGRVYSAGDVPGTQELRTIANWADGKPRGPIAATASLGLDQPNLASLAAVASGVVAVPVSDSPSEYLIWFRPERRHTVTWGGNPEKPVIIGNNPSDLSPRRSFAKWHQVVEGTSAPWTPGDLATAKMIAASVGDVILQFRSLRLLIVQNQLEQVRRQVRLSDQLVVIADGRGRILMSSNSFRLLAGTTHPRLNSLRDLIPLFSDPEVMGGRLNALMESARGWRGEAGLKTEAGEARPLMVRAEAIFSAPGAVLGYVLLFTDLSEQKAIEDVRRQSLRGILERHESMTSRLDLKDRLDYRNLFSLVIGNAERATLDISDGIDVASMPGMIDSVRTSVNRTAELLESLILHAASKPQP